MKTNKSQLKLIKSSIGVGELAKQLGVHRQTVQFWIRKKWIPVRRDYRGWPVFTVEDIEKIKSWRGQVIASPLSQKASQLLDPLVEKEEGARDLYLMFSERFNMVDEVGTFFAEMAEEESTHAAAVRFISELIKKSKHVEALKKVVPQKELREMISAINKYKRQAPKATLREAFRMAVDVESMERRCWPDGMIKALQRVVPGAFENLPKFLVDGEEDHMRLVGSYATRFGGM